MEALEGNMADLRNSVGREIFEMVAQMKDGLKAIISQIKSLRSERMVVGIEKDQGKKQDEAASVVASVNVCIGEIQAKLSKALALVFNLRL